MHSSLDNKYQQQQLQISQFIKDPTTLKLLILAGTNIKSSQLITVAKCTNLIKLDLSSNMLSDVPITFANFVQLKILYLHDNNIFTANVQNTTIEYITLFNNPFKNYRQKIVATNHKLMAVDYNIVTKKQKHTLCNPAIFTQLKWPIVQTSSKLESEEDYLNLLKAEIFVITNLCKKANSIQYIQSMVHGFKVQRDYHQIINNLTDDMKYRKSCVLDSVGQWKNYTNKKKKLKTYLKSKGKQHLICNNLVMRKLKRSPQLSQVVQRFLASIRNRLQARRVLQPHLKSYRQFIPVSKTLAELYRISSSEHQRLYFLNSELHFLEKIFLYGKRLLFNKKLYDLCDNFQKIVKRDKKQLYIFRIKPNNLKQRSFLLQTISRTISLVVSEKNIDRKHFLYTRKGHKYIGLKSRQKIKLSEQEKIKMNEKMSATQHKLKKKYDSYDTLVSYTITEPDIFNMLIRIIKFFNAGNSTTILSNQAAYFQTQIAFENQQEEVKKEKMFIGLEFFVKRSIAANIIQKFWRRITSKKNSQVNLVKIIKERRAAKMISQWLRNLPFQQRIQMNKALAYRKTIQKTNDMYIEIQIYMKMPNLSNLLKVKQFESSKHDSSQTIYNSLHKDSYVEIVELCNRKWVKIMFPSIQKVLQAYKLLLFTTFKFYYNGFYLKMFNYFQAQQKEQIQIYEKRAKHLYGINFSPLKQNNTSSSLKVSKKLTIQNAQPFFVWAQVGERGIEHRYEMQKKSVPISIFVYNKHQKPLKINCDVNWINPTSIYYNKKHVVKSNSLHGTSIRSRTPTKKLSITEKRNSFILPDDVRQHYNSKVKSQQKRDRGHSQIVPHSTALLRNHRIKNRGASQQIQVDILSQTLNIRKK